MGEIDLFDVCDDDDEEDDDEDDDEVEEKEYEAIDLLLEDPEEELGDLNTEYISSEDIITKEGSLIVQWLKKIINKYIYMNIYKKN